MVKVVNGVVMATDGWTDQAVHSTVTTVKSGRMYPAVWATPCVGHGSVTV